MRLRTCTRLSWGYSVRRTWSGPGVGRRDSGVCTERTGRMVPYAGAVSRYFDRVLAEPQLPQPPLVGLWQEAPEPLARRTVPMVNMRRILRRVRIRAQPSLALATEWSSRFPSRFAGWATTTLVLSPGFWGRRHKSRFKCSS